MVDDFGLYLVLTDPAAGYEACADAAVAEGVRYVQLRMKDRPRAAVVAVARRLRAITVGSGTRFIVNDHVDIAAEVDADGVHLGQDDMTVSEARSAWGTSGKIFGLSTHNESQEQAAQSVQPDYVGIGPVFPTPAKRRPDPALGMERAGRIARGSTLTSVVIGSINEANLADVLRHGAYNYAVVRAVGLAADPRAAIRCLQAIWRAAHPVRAHVRLA
jgi:thiamine-phosphate pyrophosphorylase